FATIQDAINAVASGGRIYVYNGTYTESDSVNKSVSLYGYQAGQDARTRVVSVGQESVVGAAAGGFYVTASNVTIDGFDVTGYSVQFASRISTSATESGYHIVNNIIDGAHTQTRGIRLDSSGAVASVVSGNKVVNHDYYLAPPYTGPVAGVGIITEHGL